MLVNCGLSNDALLAGIDEEENDIVATGAMHFVHIEVDVLRIVDTLVVTCRVGVPLGGVMVYVTGHVVRVVYTLISLLAGYKRKEEMSLAHISLVTSSCVVFTPGDAVIVDEGAVIWDWLREGDEAGLATVVDSGDEARLSTLASDEAGCFEAGAVEEPEEMLT